jgi:DNA-binding NarL/FixJ family response regulator
MTRPSTIPELIAALQQLASLPPVERARRCPELIDVAKSTLAHERGAAIAEAVADGASQAEIGRELGKSRQKINDMLAAYRTGAQDTH